MPSKDRGTHIAFFVRDDELLAKIDAEPNKQQKLLEIITKYYNGELVDSSAISQAESDIDIEIKKETLKNLKSKNINETLKQSMNIAKIANIEASTQYTQAKLTFDRNFGAPLSASGQRMLKKAIDPTPALVDTNQDPVDEKNNRFICIDCGVCGFEFDPLDRWSIAEAKEKLIQHIFDKHKREIGQFEGRRLRAFT